MYTVVIAEQKHIDSIREYDLFLQPFLEQSEAVFCAWNPEGESLGESIPDLRSAVSRGDKWRAVIVANDAGRELKNPFDRVQHRDPTWDEALTDEENRANRLAARFASYEAAARMPLSRLAAYLCELPSVGEEAGALSDDPDFRDYRAAHAKRAELQREIVGLEPQDFLKPAEIICVARRTCEDARYDIRTSWVPHLNLEYSRFTDFNLYYPKMRYVLFDVLPAAHRNYRFDNVKFLYGLLLIACNDLPDDALQAERVYTVTCKNDTANLSALLQRYDDRLLATQHMLEEEIAILRRTEAEKISDKEVASTFMTRTNIALRPEGGFNEAEIYVQPRRFGFFSDKPTEEKTIWHEEYSRSKKSLANYLKQPKKSISAAVTDVHMQSMDVVDRSKAYLLNEHQVGEFREYLRDEEAAAVESRPTNLADPTQFREQAQKAAEGIDGYLDTRMTRKTGLIAIGTALAAFFVGLVPAFFAGVLRFPVILAIAGAVVLLLAVAVVCLFFQRGCLRKKLCGYNDAISGISAAIRTNMGSYATYLGHVCSLLKGNTVDNMLNEDCDEVESRCRVYQKHIADIRDLRADFCLTFSQFLQPGQEHADDALPFSFDFRSAVTYRYPFVSGGGRPRRVQFLQEGNYIDLPVDYISRVELRREELYD